jgi:hypothetical protein
MLAYEFLQTHENGVASFGNISVDLKTLPKTSKINDYLCLPVENVVDPLKWWVNNRCLYPNLSHMALDYLSIPGMHSISYILFFFLTSDQQHQQQSNVFSLRVRNCYTSLTIVSCLPLFALIFVLVPGLNMALWC